MTEKPILFSGPMVRAILEGHKTMTRRVLPIVGPKNLGDTHCNNIETPRYDVGNRLWVREAWRAELSWQSLKPSDIPQGAAIFYEADKSKTDNGIGAKFPGKLRPSMFMPRWASRITLEVTGVKVERLNEITDNDALAEGVDGAVPATPGIDIDIDGDFWPGGPVRMFLRLWESINGPGSWDANPWVAAYTFKRVTP